LAFVSEPHVALSYCLDDVIIIIISSPLDVIYGEHCSVFFDLDFIFVCPFVLSWFSFILTIVPCYISFPFVLATYSIVCAMRSG
jgi:hypothetical protein